MLSGLGRGGIVVSLAVGIMLSVFSPTCCNAAEELSGFDRQVYEWAAQCRADVVEQMHILRSSGRLSTAQLFDTFYIPIPNTIPQKFHTQYDKLLDATIRDILDSYLNKDQRLRFVVAVDRNGYLPTHNSKYALPLTGNDRVDAVQNRTKRLFNDRTGLAAAKNTDKFKMQSYSRDTGEMMYDLSVPVMIEKRHWGAIRIGYAK